MIVRNELLERFDETITSFEIEVAGADYQVFTDSVGQVFGELNPRLGGHSGRIIIDCTDDAIEHERLELTVKANDRVVVQPCDVTVRLSPGDRGKKIGDLVCGGFKVGGGFLDTLFASHRSLCKHNVSGQRLVKSIS